MIEYNVYSHIDKDDNILYIGKSKNLKSRQNQHRNSSHWFESIEKIKYLVFKTKIEMDIAELYLINKYSPIYNKKDNRSDNISIVSIEESWINFDMQFIERKVKFRGNPMKKSGKIHQDDYGNYITSHNIPNIIENFNYKDKNFLINIFSSINYYMYHMIRVNKRFTLENNTETHNISKSNSFYEFKIPYRSMPIDIRSCPIKNRTYEEKISFVNSLNDKFINLGCSVTFDVNRKDKVYKVKITDKLYVDILKNIDCFEEIKLHDEYDYFLQSL